MLDGVGKVVYVGMSGGVDSSVAASRLLARGFQVVGVFIKVWQPNFLECNWEEERLDAMRVAAHLGIPFKTFDAVEAYRKEVGEYFINEYTAGRTPNPDVMCNQHVKFGAFLDFALANGADFVATGHYAQNIYENGLYKLYRGIDKNKDQSYFLWTLTQKQLSKILLPIGDTTKENIRHEASKLQLSTATKKDSQGVCFLGHIDIRDFLSHFTDLHQGTVLDTKGNKIGLHQGALIYTLGQRHGFTLTNANTKREVLYVVDRDIKNNTITVSAERPYLEASEKITLNDVVLSTTNFENVTAQFRYRQDPFSVTIQTQDNTTVVIPLSTTDTPAVGQSCVLYKENWCIGGGIIT